MSDPSDNLPPAPPENRRQLVALFAILLIAATVRLYDIARHPLWLDEYFSLQHSSGRGHGRLLVAASGVRTPPPDLVGRYARAPYPEIWRGMASVNADVHPPLFQVVLRAWRDLLNPLVGESDAMLRALAALFALAAVALLYDVVRLLHGVTPALWAALIMALATPQIQWAQDARPYTLLLALALGAIDAVVRLERLGPGTWRAIALAACTLGVGLTHYYGLPALFALGCYAAVRLRGRARVQAGVALLAGVALFAGLWGPSLLHQLGGAVHHTAFLRDDAPGHFGRTLVRVALLPQRSLNEPSSHVLAVACLGAVVYLLPLLLYRRRPDLLIWAFWMAGALAPPLFMDLSRKWEQLDHLRYASVVMIAFYPLMATVLDGASSRRRWLRHVLPVAAALSCAVSLPRAYAEPQTPKPDFPWLAANFSKHVRPGDVLVFYHPHDGGYPLLWYMALSWYAPQAIPETVVFLMDSPNQREAEVLRGANSVWTVSDAGAALPPGITSGRMPGEHTTGFNLPILQQWVKPSPATSQSAAALR